MSKNASDKLLILIRCSIDVNFNEKKKKIFGMKIRDKFVNHYECNVSIVRLAVVIKNYNFVCVHCTQHVGKCHCSRNSGKNAIASGVHLLCVRCRFARCPITIKLIFIWWSIWDSHQRLTNHSTIIVGHKLNGLEMVWIFYLLCISMLEALPLPVASCCSLRFYSILPTIKTK